MIYLVKANNDFVSFCQCDEALITSPPQLDCPWCGCGWLFTCMNCRMAFAFAKAVETDNNWEDLARKDLHARWGAQPAAEAITEWTSFMKRYLREAKPGETYVAFDGRIIPTSQERLDFDGWHSTHKLEFVPQVRALSDPSVWENILASANYWQSHALGDFAPSALGKPAVRDRPKKWWEFWK
jgi:hypothetical protein